MKPSSLKLLKSNGRKVRSRFLLPLAFYLLPFAFCLPLHSPLPAVAQTTDSRPAEADRLWVQGFQQYQTSRFPAALNSWQHALQIYRALKNREREGEALFLLGSTYFSLGNYAKAIEYKERSLAVAHELKNRPREGADRDRWVVYYGWEPPALRDLVVLYHSLGNYAKAIEYGERNLFNAGRGKEQGEALHNLVVVYHSLGNYAKAMGYGERSLASAREFKDRHREGTALGTLVAVYRSVGNYVKVIEYGEQRLTIARELKDRQVKAVALGKLGFVRRFLGTSAKSIDYEQDLAIAYRGEDAALNNLVTVHLYIGNYAKAMKYGEQSLAIAREIKDRQGEGAALNNLSFVHRSLGNDAKAMKYGEQSLAIAREIKDRQGEGAALNNLGFTHRSLGNYAKAMEYGERSLAIAREIKDRQGEGAALNNLDFVHRSLGNDAKATEYGERSLAIARKLKDRPVEAVALGNLGFVHRSLGNDAKVTRYGHIEFSNMRGGLMSGQVTNSGIFYRSLDDYVKAIQYGEQSLAIAREIKDRKEEGAALGNLEDPYRSLGNYVKAIEYGEQRLAIARELKDRQVEHMALVDLGGDHRSLGNYVKAIEYGERSLAVARELKDHKKEDAALNNLRFVHLHLGNYVKAIEYGERSLAIARELKNPSSELYSQKQWRGQNEIYPLSALAGDYLSLGDDAKAVEYGERSLAAARDTRSPWDESRALSRVGHIHRSLGNYAKAIEYGERSLAIAREFKDREGEDQALGLLEFVYLSLGNYAKAIEYGERSLAIDHDTKDWTKGFELNLLGAAFLKAGNLIEAEKMLVNGIKFWGSRQSSAFNDASKVSFFEEQASTYRTLQQVRVAQNNSNAALEVAEQGRARAFVDLLTQRFSSDEPNSAITSAPNQDQIRQIAKMQNATLVQYSIINDDFQIQGRPVERESVLYIWVIQPTGEITFRQVDLKPLWQKHNASLASLIIGNQEFIGVRSRSSDLATKPQPNLPTLHQLLIDPIANFLPKDPTAHVVFIPQGSLFQVPFPALQDANSNYLIQKHTILTAPSIQVLALTRQQQQKLNRTPVGRSKALVLGNPTMPQVSLFPGAPQQSLPPLPGAEAEARAIAPLLNTQAILGAEGTKAAITQKMPQASIIHLATHGLLDNVRGLGSAIALAPSGNDNGWLTAEEILDMELQADLVVLSACETGGGRITGDGVIGLSRSLISVGVPSVIVSLWSVPDAPTAELMQSFYQNRQKNLNKAQALRQAMLTTMKTHPEPRDWAAFTLIGEAE